MRKIAVLLLLVLVALLAWWKIGQQQRTTPSPQSTAGISPTSATPFCIRNDLQALLMLDHAAGNVYGRFSLKNISDHQCQLSDGKFIDAQYSAVSTITVTHVEHNALESSVLAPQQTIYSQVHYPNGPQCSGMTKSVNVTFVYPLASGDDVSFLDQMGQQSQVVQTCASANERTEIQIWSMSDQPTGS